jgi:hypothetical protein
MFDESYLDSLPNDPLLAVNEITHNAIDYWADLPSHQLHTEVDFFLEAFAIAKALLDNVPAIDLNEPEIVGTPNNVVDNI